ncbi:MAG: hypothetical protein HC902_00020 [Calothrix sp. SM1_5_4]|nr:hypothetical protein [Calothrix sp. SM1_5_4]
MRMTLESAFTLGSARTYLTSGRGSFSLDGGPRSLERIAVKNVTLGCFSVVGSDFSKSAVKPTW